MSTLSETDKKLLSDIELYGWHVIKVPEDRQGPSFGYSVGFYYSFQHPEVLIIGLDLDVIHFLINKLGDNIRDGLILQPGFYYSNIIEDVNCYFTKVDQQFYQEYASYNEWFYKDKEYGILQCIYPTIAGVYPWANEYPKILKDLQPILGPRPDQIS